MVLVFTVFFPFCFFFIRCFFSSFFYTFFHSLGVGSDWSLVFFCAHFVFFFLYIALWAGDGLILAAGNCMHGRVVWEGI